jgi:hypothetical protein
MNMDTFHRTPVLSLAAVVALAACTATGGVSARDAWVRVTDPTRTAAGYMVIENSASSADALLSVSTPAYARVELHEVVEVPAPAATSDPMASPGPTGSMDGMSGGATMMQMQPVAEIPVPANGSVELKSGSYHLMMMEPIGTITIGQTIELTLTFKSGATVMVSAEIRGV